MSNGIVIVKEIGSIVIQERGKPGKDGLDGVGDKTFLFNQGIVSDTWVINHEMDKKPSVEVKDSAGSSVEGFVDYTDLDNLTITFSGAFTGQAILN